MVAENILKFKNRIYQKMKTEDRVYSAYNLSSEYISSFGFEFTKEEIFNFFASDNRFLCINRNQILLKEIVDKIISQDFLNKDVDYIENFIREKYFISTINHDIILEIVGKYRQDNRVVFIYTHRNYDIRNKDDFDNVIIKEGKISYSALEEVSKFLEIGVPELIMELEDKNIYMNEVVEMSYQIYKSSLFQETKSQGNNCKSYENVLKLARIDEVQEFNAELNTISQENILALDLYPNELIACMLMLSNNIASYDISKNCFDNQHLRALLKIGILVNVGTKCTLTKLGKELIDKFQLSIIRNLKYDVNQSDTRYCTTRELSKSFEVKCINNCKEVWDDVAKVLKDVYSSNYFSKRFLSLVELANKNNFSSMYDVFNIAISNDRIKDLYEVLVGDKASNGIKPILEGKEVCFKCDNQKCIRNTEKKLKEKRLLYYRQEYANQYIFNLRSDYTSLKNIQHDPLLIKFIIPYAICVPSKILMTKLNIIEDSKILYKNAGQYCPTEDKWVIKDDLLVQPM
jgi:hypothetical protein